MYLKSDPDRFCVCVRGLVAGTLVTLKTNHRTVRTGDRGLCLHPDRLVVKLWLTLQDGHPELPGAGETKHTILPVIVLGFLLRIILFIYLFLAMLGLACCSDLL